tara:strand:+ start:94 stop:399 length:306 start_codon:yes stop_codon:yes gene_type:complete
MQKIIKLTEVREEPSSYCPTAEKCKVSFSKRALFLNANHISMMREDTTIAAKLVDCLDTGGLVSTQKFTKLALNSGNSNTTLTVVGGPEKIMKQIRGTDEN